MISHRLCVYHLLQTSLPHLRLDCNRPCGSFFIGTWDNDDMCQWANCHSKTWQELLQKITNIIPRQGEWRSLFSSATPHPLLPISFIIRYQILEWEFNVPLIKLAHWLVDIALRWPNIELKLNPLIMTRTEYELIYDAFKSHRYKMTDAQEVLAEKILDDLFYPHFDALKGPVD